MQEQYDDEDNLDPLDQGLEEDGTQEDLDDQLTFGEPGGYDGQPKQANPEQPTPQRKKPQVDGLWQNNSDEDSKNPSLDQPGNQPPKPTGLKEIKPSDSNRPSIPREKFQAGGGEAIKAKNVPGAASTGGGKADKLMGAANLLKNGIPKDKEGVENLQNEVAAKGIGMVAKAALVASGVGAAASGIAGDLAEKAARKLKPLKQQKIILTVAAFIIATAAIIMITVTAGLATNFSGGILGRSEKDPASASDSLENLTLGSQYSLANLSQWYFNQGDPKWGKLPGQTGGWSKNSYRARGCAITASAMIIKYYGVQNINPYLFGGYVARKSGTMRLNPSLIASFLQEQKINKKLVAVPMNVEAVRAEIAAGNPVLAQGQKAFYASGQHWVVIGGISEDGKFLIINDPSATRFRGKSGRLSSAHELSPRGRIKALYAFHNK